MLTSAISNGLLTGAIESRLKGENALLQGRNDPAEPLGLSKTPQNSGQDVVSTSEQGMFAAARMQNYEHALSFSQTMNLQLKTQEGDLVTVDFRQLYAEYRSYKEQQAGQVGPEGVRYFESREAMEMTAFEERFAFSVDGELNEDELNAVFDVFEQVGRLADRFYSGDVEAAFEQAVQMDLDYGQLQSMQLNLSQQRTEVSRYQQAAVAQYQSLQPDSANETVPSSVRLPDYFDQWEQTVAKLDELFANSRAFVDELMAKLMPNTENVPEVEQNAQAPLERIQDFHNRLRDWVTNPFVASENELAEVA
ncbi:hypothetical protein QCB44_00620 [Thiomicrorhabdus sp. zzn3]|uniref:hypothetical protein n=1 Tax=Thiomicrorhabdus sp. zzn3 TaxID=3039775 RepID=UPI002436ACBC|nr:hypothetical protein [Thiomicrorhabdus sp. zzn3]MDG6777199.1 hypothetical protein [Thiomicrorhabdus sp. zzn3]